VGAEPKEILAAIVATCPTWVTLRTHNTLDIYVDAQPPRKSGKLARIYDLRISVANDGKVTAQEASANRLLPSSCPERHINDGGVFCIGLRADIGVTEGITAAVWWQKLEVFLNCQETAEVSGRWPPLLQVSHGEAADFQVAAEKMAERMGKKTEYENAVAFDEGPIAELSKQVSKITGRLPQPRMPCFCGYTEDGRIKRRQQCARDNNLCLPILERRRRRAEADFWQERKRRVSCCGTMKICPLK
jgi:hypothetical protein